MQFFLFSAIIFSVAKLLLFLLFFFFAFTTVGDFGFGVSFENRRASLLKIKGNLCAYKHRELCNNNKKASIEFWMIFLFFFRYSVSSFFIRSL